MPRKPEGKIDLTANARTVLERRYLWRDAEGSFTETPEGLFERVATAVAKVEKKDRAAWAESFLRLMATRRFMPNSPTLMNAGRKGGQLSACYVLPVEDSLDGIFDSLKYTAKIHQSGGGTGFSFSKLRPRGSVVRSTHGIASGPVSFIRIFDTTTETIKQGGARRGANMAILRVDHPDIEEFIDSKRDQRSILNFNISVGVTDEFMRAVEADGNFPLRDPSDGKVRRQVRARALFDRMAQAAWECGDPGVVFLDRINEFNPTPKVGPMESTNPCVTGDTRVWVENAGLVPIAELVGQLPRIGTEVQGKGAFRSSARVIRTGVRSVLRLRTSEGYELRLTADHRVMTGRGDVPAAELKIGDEVRLAEMPVSPVSWESHDARLGELIGWLVGDGHFTIHEQGKPTAVLNFYGIDKKEAAPRLLDAVRGLIGDPSLTLCEVESRDLAYVRSSRLRRELARIGVEETSKEYVPEAIWRGSRDLVAGYLRGLFSADGSVQGSLEKGMSVRLASNQEELLSGAQTLLLHLGIKSVLYRNRRAAGPRMMPDSQGILRKYPCAAQYELIVSKSSLATYARLVGFVVLAKQAKLEEALGSYRRGPYQEQFFAKVEKVVQEGEEEVFDLTEPETSHFYANGILVHNCGEQPLLPYESCNLGSLNLGLYATEAGVDWNALRGDVKIATRFLDNVIDINTFPVRECAEITRRNRKIGLGVMGFADLLLILGIPYDSAEGLALGEKVMSFIDREAKIASSELARSRGAFPNWKSSMWEELGYPKLRNATVSTVAPTGTISIIAGCSSGIEPIFSGVFFRNVLAGERLIDIHPSVERAFRQKGHRLDRISEEEIERTLGRAWRPAGKVAIEDHVRMQAVFQRFSDSAVSKTINLPESATCEQVAQAYLLAYRSGCKGITIYRDRSRTSQVLERPRGEETPAEQVEPLACPSC